MDNKRNISAWMIWTVTLVLIVPNILLDITEPTTWMSKAVNVLLPIGIYLSLLSISRHVGRTIMFFIPLMVYCAFQIVLLYLYGNSIIAVDMFLNVVTTNYTEASELLLNMRLAITIVVILYLPIIIYGIVAICKKWRVNHFRLLRTRFAGLCFIASGLALLIAGCAIYPQYNPLREIFPANVTYNSILAYHRCQKSDDYPITSQGFSYDAKVIRNLPDTVCQAYVLVIGETSRAENWSLMGYERPTNPKLAARKNIVAFPNVMSQSNTTHKSVPMLLTYLSASDFGDSIYSTKSIISAFAQAGFGTAYLSAQRHNGSFIDYFGNEAQTCKFIVEEGEEQQDRNLLPHLTAYLDTAKQNSLFIVLHTYGSHFNYADRYTEEFAQFQPTNYPAASPKFRQELINAYDNSILSTDAFVDSVIGILASRDIVAGMLYVSDHGEDIYDDGSRRFLHASPIPSQHQLHVPMVLWTSDSYNSLFPSVNATASANEKLSISSTLSAFHTIMQLAGISSPYFDATKSVVSADYTPATHLYLNDYNEPTPIASEAPISQKASLSSIF